jgi:glycosyltransferase involved in cell wall biosynthesis
MEKVDVSVIIPNYNHAAFLQQRIESVLKQTSSCSEILILDDCSTDNSKSVIEQYKNNPKVHIHYNSKNSGSPFKQWKRGIKLAKGKYIWIAESDDYAEPEFLQTILELLEKGNGLAYCRSADVDENGNKKSDFFWADGLDENRWKNDFQNSGDDEVKNYLVYRCTIPNASACVFRKDLAPLNSGFDKMRYCGDWLFWIQLLEQTSIAYSSNVMNSFRHHTSSTRNKKSDKEELRKKLEIISIVEKAREKYGLGQPIENEYKKYDWAGKGFYRNFLIPRELKHKTIFYANRHFPYLYKRYRQVFR